MFKNLGLRKRFMLILLMIYLCSLPVMIASTYYILRKNVEAETFEKADFFLSAMEAARKQNSDVIRPAVMKAAPDRFILEAMSSTFNVRGIAEKIKARFPHYIFKHASSSPRFAANKADAFEEGILKAFKSDRKLAEWKGIEKKDDGEYFVLARPDISRDGCLLCHSTPENAPAEIVARYGATASFGWKEGDVVAALVAYVPTTFAKETLWKSLVVFSSFYSGLFLVILAVIDRLITANIIKPIELFVETAEEISRGRLDREFTVSSNDEIRTLADAFTRMKISLAKAMDIIRKK